MLTPAKYWRVPCPLDGECPEPPTQFTLPAALVTQAQPPTRGHGITIAAYDDAEQIGLFRWLGIIQSGTGAVRQVDWRPVAAQIWVDTLKGRGYWQQGAFGFAKAKLADYGLHELWQAHFDDLDPRSTTSMKMRPTIRTLSASRIASQRLNPVEIVGSQTDNPRTGVVYALRSAYGYKVGRTRNVPQRMRAFGVQLPFAYSIPLCAWFDDCHLAERYYHTLFASKRINGEWFDLDEADLALIRARSLGAE